MNFPKVFPSIEDINNIVGDFARKYTWNISFDDGFNRNGITGNARATVLAATRGMLTGGGKDLLMVNVPLKFKEWIPAESCQIIHNSTASFDVQGGILGTQIPKQQDSRTLSITLYDNYAYDFSVWMYTWRKQIVNTITGYDWVLPVMDACCKCKIICYDSVGHTVHAGIYYVYPTDQHQSQFDSGGDAFQFDSEFVIAGTERELFDGNTIA